MTKPTQALKDGTYEGLNATLVIEKGRAMVILHTAFQLPEGTTIPLQRSEGNLIVEYPQGTLAKNGHAII